MIEPCLMQERSLLGMPRRTNALPQFVYLGCFFSYGAKEEIVKELEVVICERVRSEACPNLYTEYSAFKKGFPY